MRDPNDVDWAAGAYSGAPGGWWQTGWGVSVFYVLIFAAMALLYWLYESEGGKAFCAKVSARWDAAIDWIAARLERRGKKSARGRPMGFEEYRHHYVSLTPMHLYCLYHWATYRPKMCRKLEARGELLDNVMAAARDTESAMADLMNKGMKYHEAWEVMREEWVLLPDEETVPRLGEPPREPDARRRARRQSPKWRQRSRPPARLQHGTSPRASSPGSSTPPCWWLS